MTLSVKTSLLDENTKRSTQAPGASSENPLNKQPNIPLDKRPNKLASPSKFVYRSHISPLRRQHPYLPSSRLSPLTAKMYKKMEACRIEKENFNPQTITKNKSSKKPQMVEGSLLNYFKPDSTLETLSSVTKDLGEIKALLLEVKEGNSTAIQVKRLDNVIDQLETKLQSYQPKQGRAQKAVGSGNSLEKVSTQHKDNDDIKEKAARIEELERKLTEFEANHIPKAEYDRLKQELAESQELIDECKACLEEIDSTKPQDMSDLQKKINEQSLLIEGLQDRLAVAEFHKANYERAQEEIAELRAALEDLINENEMLHNS
ncbi:hypothetical protein K493DRAFT_3424 [Basidiobolus meristosporus CBS 931.73]|uniref:Uncharacterized protein n=1 Tax=Basidiobolus meristosporus CBS 931.73 TaxID=1314790 RepID=A0A1Y1YLW1_9FUNG|nr:hypothetical protein K493DRAFT_3424 [Basidiobolus meristosporus CBS 931.73]|eukprot:ORX98997.1 hypothetical protein K493DRAFT_3424 [Basidiobolus meristosporus CBS 931.73]